MKLPNLIIVNECVGFEIERHLKQYIISSIQALLPELP